MSDNNQSQETKPVAKPKVAPVILDEDKNTTLHYAAATGDQEKVQAEIDAGQKLDVENYLGWTPLMMAVRNEHFQIAKLLIDHRADTTKKNHFGMSVFLICVTSGNLEMITFLLQHLLCGGISRQSIQKTFSPVSVAILFNQAEVVRYLVEMSFDINHGVPFTGITPLMIAAAMNFKDIYSLLLEKGADINKKNVLGDTVEMQTKKRKPKSKHDRLCVPQIPMILVSPQSLLHFHSPMGQNCQSMRKSSNTMTPTYIAPNVTPITPASAISFCPQYFFPPDFSPSQPVIAMSHMPPISPMPPNVYSTNDIMNMRINQNAFISPVVHSYSSPCA